MSEREDGCYWVRFFGFRDKPTGWKMAELKDGVLWRHGDPDDWNTRLVYEWGSKVEPPEQE